MCLFIATLFLGPRAALLFWWLIDPGRFSDAFNSFIWPLLGILFLPWSTLVFLILWSWGGGFNGLDWLFLGLAFLADISMYAGGGYSNRERVVYVSR
jgi:hypothetical protein